MENAVTDTLKEKISLEFRFLPAYAQYLLHHCLEEFVEDLVRLYEEMDVPILRFFKDVKHDQRIVLVTASNREMLSMIGSRRTEEFVAQTISNWLNNQLPVISREQVHSHDITLVNYCRARALRKYITRYTSDQTLHQDLVEDIERFTLILNTELTASYMELQKQEINNINQALKRREAQLLEAQEIGQVGSFEWDLIGKQSSYTPQVFKIFEMDGPSNVSSFINDVHPDEREKVRRAIEKALVDGTYECEYRYIKNNKEKVIYSRGKVQFAEGKPARMIGTVSDVTERHRIIDRLRESEKLHQQAQALTHIGNWSWQIGSNKVVWSDEMYRIYGLEPQSEEITYERFLSFVHPDDKELRQREIQRSLETLEVQEYHFRIIAAGGTEKVLRGKGEVTSDSEGKPLAMLGTCQDVTKEYTLTQQLREREQYLQELNRSLEAANQELSRTNEELESFNFIASHDLQEPLRKIQVYSNRILEAGTELSPTLQDYFTRINNASRRMQKLIEDFLSFSQTFKNPQPRELVNVNAIVDEIKNELATRIEEKRARIEVGQLPQVCGIPFQVKQLMTNLISNALKYTRADVVPRIVISGQIVQGMDLKGCDGDPRQTYAKIAVADNGIGFDPKYTAKIFELFQRLHSKDLYSGTGIGLALCKKIVERMGGCITAESEPGQGATFTFYVPQT